jgi:hypothetical protein
MRRASIVLALLLSATAAPFACSRVEEPNPAPRASASASASASAPPTTSATVSTSAPVTASPSASTSATASASASAAAIAPTVFDGTWVFSRFDLTDPATAAKWSGIPADAQAEILSNAPQATLVLSKGTIVTKLTGVPDKRSTFTVASSASEKEIVIATSDEGRKRLRLLNDGAMRVEDLDAKDTFVTIFVRKK